MRTHVVVADALHLRASPSVLEGTSLRVLPNGAEVQALDYAEADARWLEVVDAEGVRGFVLRRHLAQKSPPRFGEVGGLAEHEIADVVWRLTHAHDGIRYGLGCKAGRGAEGGLKFAEGPSCDGKQVDCSGWVRALFGAVAEAANERSERKVFANRDVALLSTHSDAQIAEVERRTGLIVSGPQIRQVPLRSGVLVGIDTGDWAWERTSDRPARIFGVDHIVMYVKDPATGVPFITQSSSSGGGVNMVAWDAWLTRMADVADSWRMHAVDPFLLGDISGLAPMGAAHDPDDVRLDELTFTAPGG